MSFVRNAWYAVCWSEDLASGGTLARTLLCRHIVLWRTTDGVAALEDRCCHRSLPLSLGRVIGTTLQCGYHGLEFDRAGRCVKVPGQSHIPPDSTVRAYPVCERHGLIWLWPGDAGAADTVLIPDLPWLDDPGWTRTGGCIDLEADYRLLIDNLLDLTHVSYIHKNTLAGDPAEALVPVTTTREGDTIRVERWMRGFTAPPMYNRARRFAGKVDRWQLIRWQAPSTVTLDIGCADAGTGAPEGDRSHGISMWSNHIITPETETTTHYLWSFARNFKLGDETVSKTIAQDGLRTFLEDTAVLEAQQRSISTVGDRATVDIRIDNAPMQFRRILGDMIAREGAEAA